MSSDREWARTLGLLQELWPGSPLSPDAAAAYEKTLEPFSHAEVRQALVDLAAENRPNRPPPGVIRARVSPESADSHPVEDAAMPAATLGSLREWAREQSAHAAAASSDTQAEGQAASDERQKVPAALAPNQYAGFWIRFVAWWIDGLLAFIATTIVTASIVSITLGTDQAAWEDSVALNAGTIAAVIVGPWLYFALQESSRRQATIGKRVVGIGVCDLEGERISFARASGRFFAKLLPVVGSLGFLMAAFTPKKQALHDLLARTLVVYREQEASRIGTL